MGTLKDLAADPATRQKMVAEALHVLDLEVDSKGGLGGLAIKAAYKVAKGAAPGFIHKVMNVLLDEFLGALDPYYDEAKQNNASLSSHFRAKTPQIANSLLSITDSRARAEGGGAVKATYEKLRPSAIKHVEAGVPRLADLAQKFAPL